MGYVDTKIRQSIPGSDSHNIVYPATLDNYADSVAQGVADAKQRVGDYAAMCPDTAIVLLGWSQGGQVMTELLAGDNRIDLDLALHSTSFLLNNCGTRIMG